ncbi:MAG: hypothetical protein NDI90_15510 [Nitrospira sp. BO4]|nr:hypothetical protein [Nitrospira sp. BO4]
MAQIKLVPKKREYPDGVKLHRTLADGSIEYLTSFKDSDELVRAMSVIDPATGKAYYDTNEAYREAVIELVANTPAEQVGIQLEPRNPIPDNDQMMQGLLEDAYRAEFSDWVDRAGGTDARAKLQFAQHFMNPSDETRTVLEGINRLTQRDAGRPFETFLKERKAAGLGPQCDSMPMESEEELAAKEAAHNKEILEWMAQEEVDAVPGGDEGVEV